MATSPRRSPGTRRCPMSGRPACCGVILARRESRNSRTSVRLSTSTTLRLAVTAWDALAVHVSTGSARERREGVTWMVSPRRTARHPLRRRRIMRATMMYAPGDVRVEERPEPSIQSPPAGCVSLSAACICGSDLWPYRGSDPVDGPIPMGHEYVGIVEEVGADVT